MGRPLPAALGLALDGVNVSPALTGIFQDLLGSAARIRSVSGRIVKRRTLRYTVELEGAPSPSCHLIGKVYETRAESEQGFEALRWLWSQGFSTQAPLGITVPRALAFLPEFELVIMEEAGGRSLKRMLNKNEGGAKDMRLFAEVLIKLHRFPATFGPPLLLEQHLEQRCAGLCESLASAFPDLAEPIERIVSTARKAGADEVPIEGALAHGDYHPGQVQLDGERQWLVDLDLLHTGDPAYDVAMAVLTMKGMGARLGQEPRFGRLLDGFLASYFAGMDRSIAERVPFHAALIFLKRACKRFRYQNEPAWEDDVRLQIRLGEECLSWMKRRRAPRDLPSALELCGGCPAAV